MRIAYYPGCTLKLTAQNLEAAALASLRALGLVVEELPRWNCCGAVASLAEDDLLHQVAPVRDLVRAAERGADRLLTLCAPCYNTLARANRLMAEDEEKRKTINLFMEEEPDYAGQVKVVHLLDFLRDDLGFEALATKVVRPLTGLKVAPYYGCMLLRPKRVAIEEHPTLLHRLLAALGAETVDFPAMTDCCGAYQILGHEAMALDASAAILRSATRRGAQALVTSCPLCDYNLGARQPDLRDRHGDLPELPVYYFTQLLALALGCAPEALRLDLSPPGCRRLLAERGAIAAAT
ncbi:MAG: CoB--CoM heterodisulfide reductase iron-sulfur subunit B family protein [Deltaproteobacteria bacterium]|nr:CoB--CoM heterodisulfide reductase iron-sulfur subunit B family protein [Deltaproteobacteria bacterium]